MATSHIPLASLERKKINGRFAPTIPECQCKHCGVTYRPKRTGRVHYCTRDCAYAAQKAAVRPKEKERGQYRRVFFSTCTQCGNLFAGRTAVSRYCTESCKSRYANMLLVGSRPARPCRECNAEFSPSYGEKIRRFCSRSCGKRHNKRSARIKRKAKVKSVTVESVNPYKVFERDQWTCRICGNETPRKLRGTYHPLAPEIDHIMPLAKGGDHSYANTQCTCRSCNAIKSDTFSACGEGPITSLDR